MSPSLHDHRTGPFRIKICGVRTTSDVEAAAAVGADSVGLNFYAKSPRYVGNERTRAALVNAAHQAGVRVVGLFVNESPELVRRAAEALKLDVIQLHGDELPAFHVELRGLSVVRAFRVAPGELAKVEEYLAECNRLDASPDAMLIDGFSPSAYGGVGERADWAALSSWAARGHLPPLILAGGLSAENVHAAIRAVLPAAVDVASGVESAPGVKSSERIAAFASAAKQGFVDVASLPLPFAR